jgi:hypothetical protein
MAENPDNEEVELHPAHCWDCPSCGKHNFVDGVRIELTDEDRESLARQFGDDDDEGEEWKRGGEEDEDEEDDNEWEMGVEMLTFPSLVKCEQCKKSFPVERPDGFDPRDL